MSNINYESLTSAGANDYSFAETAIEDDGVIGEAALAALGVMGRYWNDRPWTWGETTYDEAKWVEQEVDEVIRCLTRWKKEYQACRDTMLAEETVKRAVATGEYGADFTKAAGVLARGTNGLPNTLFRECVGEEKHVPADEHQPVG